MENLYLLKNIVKERKRESGYKLLIRSLKIPYGAKIAITGPSGCGKSTTLDLLGLSLKPDSAEQFVFSPPGKAEDIFQLWLGGKYDRLADLRLKHMGYVLQTGELLPFLSAGENMLLTAAIAGMPKEQAEESARKIAALLGVEHLWHAMPATLSVGERQRAAITRALAARPQVILADEPTAALDPLHAEKVMAAFLEALNEYGSALILATHNAAWAAQGGMTEYSFRLEQTENGVTAILDETTGCENEFPNP